MVILVIVLLLLATVLSMYFLYRAWKIIEQLGIELEEQKEFNTMYEKEILQLKRDSYMAHENVNILQMKEK